MPVMKEMAIGARFGILSVIEAGIVVRKNGVNVRFAKCRCDCGNTKLIRHSTLRYGTSKSCGCEMHKHIKHGGARKGNRSPEYKIWSGIKARCRIQSATGFSEYGAVGVEMCSEWDDFSVFLRDMGQRPSSSMSVDRMDSTKGYCKENCRWATDEEQSLNRKCVTRIEFYGIVKSLAAWSRISQVSRSTIKARLMAGWQEKLAVWTPTGRKDKRCA